MNPRIRHVLDSQDHFAVYVMKREPYGALLKLTDRCLVTRDGPDDEPVDEIVGYIISEKGYRPADEVSQGTKFLGYTTPEIIRASGRDPASYLTQLQQWGRDWAAQSQPAPAALFDPDEDDEPEVDTQPRRKRGR